MIIKFLYVVTYQRDHQVILLVQIGRFAIRSLKDPIEYIWSKFRFYNIFELANKGGIEDLIVKR